MKSRILEYIQAISVGEHPLFEELQEHFGFTSDKLQQRAGEVLRNILHSYSRFSITTIDTFFNQVIRSFTREIGLHGGYEIELDTDLVLQKVVDDLMTEIDEDDQLKQWLIEFSRNRLQEGKSWEFRSEISKLARELFNENYQVRARDLKQLDRATLATLRKWVDEQVKSFEKTLHEIGREGINKYTAVGLSEGDFSYGSGGPVGQFSKWFNGGDDLQKEPGKRVFEGMQDASKWSKKASPLRDQIISVTESELIPLMEKGVQFWQEGFTDYMTAHEVKRYLFTYGLLNDLAKRVDAYRQDNEVILISDLPVFLKDIIGDSETPYVFEKVGTRYRHFLIDEFQDTSGFQWDNFRPLIKNSLDSVEFNMVVGDVKQSIYRWRGGNADILLHQMADQVGNHFVNEQQLKSNFRSSRQVIDFNNNLFTTLPSIVQSHLEREFGEVGEEMEFTLNKITQSFNEAHQGYPEKIKEGGFIRIQLEQEERDAEETWDDLAIAWTIDQVEKLQDQQVALKDIAILVRWNSDAAKLVNALLAKKQEEESKYKYDVVSSESMFLDNSVVVNFLLSVFKYLKNNKDKIALAEIVKAYEIDIKGATSSVDDVLNKSSIKIGLPKTFKNYLNMLVRLPLYELTEALIRIFELNKLTDQIAYLQAFQDSVLEYVKKEKSDINSFLIWWSETGYKRTVKLSEDLEAIKILTVHKSKGLQYKTVLMPFCNWNLDHETYSKDMILWVQDQEKDPYNNLPAVPLKYNSKLENTHFRNYYFQEKIASHIDNLNLLYVAFTRAEEGLFVFCRDNKKKELKTVSDLVKAQLSELPEFDQQAGVLQLGTFEFSESKASSEEHEVKLEQYLSEKWRNKITIKKQSDPFIEEEPTERQSSINQGVVMHKILANIKYHDDVKPALEEAYHHLEINKEELQQIESAINGIFANEEISNWFSKDWEVRTEALILPGQTDAKRLDRVVIKGNQAVVIDFKTGKPKKADEKQVREYMQLLVDMGFDEVSGKLVYVTDVSVVSVNFEEEVG